MVSSSNKSYKTSEYSGLSDEDLVNKAQLGDTFAEQTLTERYMGFVRLKARPYFLVGADKSDLVQEGSIGLLGAIRDFDASKQVSFIAFAEVCIKNHMKSAMEGSNREKHKPLNNYISIYKPVGDDADSGTTLGDNIPESPDATDPETVMINREDINYLIKGIQSRLSDLERNVLIYYLDGKSYEEISKLLDRSQKSVDNALQRIKKKLRKLINERNSNQ